MRAPVPPLLPPELLRVCLTLPLQQRPRDEEVEHRGRCSMMSAVAGAAGRSHRIYSSAGIAATTEPLVAAWCWGDGRLSPTWASGRASAGQHAPASL